MPRYAGESHFDSACMRVQLKTGGNSLEKGVYPQIFAASGGGPPAAPGGAYRVVKHCLTVLKLRLNVNISSFAVI